MPQLIVVGSINQDTVLTVETHPAAGETVLAVSTTVGLGGKGCNQAIAAALAGARVSFVGAIGNDAAGDLAVSSLEAGGVDVTAISRHDDAATGAAYITVDQAGENTIVVASGANAAVTADAASDALGLLLDTIDAPVLLVQGELPRDVTRRVAAIAHQRGLRLIVNLAPVSMTDAAALAAASTLIVNQTEAATLLGATLPALEAATALRDRFATDIVVTVGAEGAIVATAAATAADTAGDTASDTASATAGAVWRQPSPKPKAVVDTTGAGDAFVGVLAASLCEGLTLSVAVVRAVAAGSYAVAGAGTVGSYASADQLDALVAEVPTAVDA